VAGEKGKGKEEETKWFPIGSREFTFCNSSIFRVFQFPVSKRESLMDRKGARVLPESLTVRCGLNADGLFDWRLMIADFRLQKSKSALGAHPSASRLHRPDLFLSTADR
jgi:hypothetical protein